MNCGTNCHLFESIPQQRAQISASNPLGLCRPVDKLQNVAGGGVVSIPPKESNKKDNQK